jgi:hypothetical protein
MSKKFDEIAKQIGDALIDLSDLLDAKLEKWSDAPKRPNDLSDTELVGFINKEAATAALNLVIDIQAPANAKKATLRIWGIESELDSNRNERFNNVQLDFDMEYALARVLTQKGAAVTRDDIRTALHDQNTQLSHLIASNQSGFDEASRQPLGERYDLAGDELNQYEDDLGTMGDALNTILSSLKASAAA